MIKTDILIIGAGPTGLFTVFEAGLLKLKCHLIDALPQPGGQCSEIYPKKPIYDIPAYPEILAGDLTSKLLEQISSFQPGFTLGERAETIEKLEDDTFIVTTNKGTKHHAPIVAIAGGLGSFEPRKPPIPNIAHFEDAGVEYIIRDPEVYRDKKVVIAGGGDSALDWAIFLTDIASEVSLVHRRNEFRGALDSVDKVQELKDAENESYIYMVHSYYAALSSDTIAVCHYDIAYSAALAKDNFFGTQFHPEKSSAVGNKILENFLVI